MNKKEASSLILKSKDNDNGNNNNNDEELSLLERRKIENATDGLYNYYHKLLSEQVPKDNATIIANYIMTMKTEVNLSDAYRKSVIHLLSMLSKYHNHKSFRELSHEDIIIYLDSMRKTESQDPLHKWIGTYNLFRVHFIRFFKWLYYPNIEQDKRPKPSIIGNIPKLKRKEQSIYKPSDLWTTEDDALFLKYCPDKRIRCYHTIARDSSCRPNEILKLRIKDVVFKSVNNYQYAEVLVNGKTGTRHIPLINSIPYLKDWLDDHPQRGNSNSFLILSRCRKYFGKKMTELALRNMYANYKQQFFPRMIQEDSANNDNDTIPLEDKQKIKELLKKPWNPYIRRHSALTEKSKILKEHVLRQHAGWSGRSQMHLKYLHYYGNESSESLLEAYGIVTKENQELNFLKPKQCPNCSEPNKPDSKFCAKCRMVLTYDAYTETLEEKQVKDREVENLKTQMAAIQDAQREVLEMLKDPTKILAILKRE
jgi:integrase